MTDRRTAQPTGLAAELDAATALLTDAGVPTPRADAERLAEFVVSTPPQGTPPGDTPPAAGPLLDRQRERFREVVLRRARREPVERIVGTAPFRGLVLQVGPGVYVPQPETEVVVQWALDAMAADGLTAPLVVDLCTGSGTCALGVAADRPDAVVHAVERSPEAIAWARHNVAATGLAVTLHEGDIVAALHELDGTVDLVISNPPYVAEDELPSREPEVRDHDPRLALVGGSDGLEMVGLVEGVGRRLLRPGGRVVVEHSDRQGATAPAVFAGPAWDEVADHVDLRGRDRFVTARRR